jgi:hypothetical protein
MSHAAQTSLASRPSSSRLPLPPLLSPPHHSVVRQARGLPVVWMFPPSSPLHQMLFLPMFPRSATPPSDLCPHLFLPSNEKYIEGLESIWMRMASGGLYSRGVLLLTSHRIIFIQYPTAAVPAPPAEGERVSSGLLHPRPSSSKETAPFVVTIPLCLVSSVSLRRRWKDRFHTLGLICKNQIGYLFVCSRDEDEFVPLRAFRRMQMEILWRKEEDNFATGLDLASALPPLLEPQTSTSSSTSSSTIKLPLCSPLSTPQIPATERGKRISEPFSLSAEYTRSGDLPPSLLPL